MSVRRLAFAAGTAAVLLAGVFVHAVEPQTSSPAASGSASAERTLLNQYCVTCHNDRTRAGELALDTVDPARVAQNPELWEKVVRKLRTRAMPPAGVRRPDEGGYGQLLSYLEGELDRRAATAPDPGRPDTFRRLTRTEYRTRSTLRGRSVTELLPKTARVSASTT
jgi:mono/diheme cytochrome c family protein